MFRATMSGTFLGPARPSWVDQLLSPESLRATGYFDPTAVAHHRGWQVRIPRITPARFVFDEDPTNLVWLSDMFEATREVWLPAVDFGAPFDP